MGFERPHLLLLLLLGPLLALAYRALVGRRARHAVAFPNLTVLASVAGRPSWRRHAPSALGLVVLAVLAVALARPHVTRLQPVEGATVILAIDTSESMLASDIRPSRLEAARAAARAFVAEVPRRLRVGVVLFAGDVEIGAPPSDDHDVATSAIDAMGPSGVAGTAIGDAVARSVELGREALGRLGAGDPARDAVSVVFLSDGRQYLGTLQPEDGVRRARAAGVPVHTVALGSTIVRERDGSFRPFVFGRFAPDPAALESIAQATGGEFVAASSGRDLTRAYADLGSRLGRAPRRSELTVLAVAAGAALLAVAGLLSAAWRPRLP